MASPLVAVIVLNHNGIDDTRECLNSLRRTDYDMFHVYIVDNGSRKDEGSELKREFPDLIYRVIRSPTNLGFAEGNNIVLRRILGDSRYSYVVCLNNDTVVDPNWLRPLVDVAEQNHDVAAVGGKVYSYWRRNIIDSTGGLIFFDGSAIARGHGRLDSGQYDNKHDVFGISATCVLYRLEALRSVGIFDADFFAYYEDLDLAWRLRLFGWRSCFTPESRIWHKYSRTLGSLSLLKVFLRERNRIWILIKNYPGYLSLIGIVLGWLKLLYEFLLRGTRTTQAAYVRRFGFASLFSVMVFAWFRAFARLRKSAKKRKTIRFQAKNFSVKVARAWLKEYGAPLKDVIYGGLSEWWAEGGLIVDNTFEIV